MRGEYSHEVSIGCHFVLLGSNPDYEGVIKAAAIANPIAGHCTQLHIHLQVVVRRADACMYVVVGSVSTER